LRKITQSDPNADLLLLYTKPAGEWLEALPIGNGRLGAMVFGGVPEERLQLNESTLWAGGPHNYDNPDALDAMPEVRRLIFAGEWQKAQDLASAKCMGKPVGQMSYQSAGNLILTMADSGDFTDYHRALALDGATVRTTYTAGGMHFEREVFASYPDQVIAMNLAADRPDGLAFHLSLTSPHQATVAANGHNTLILSGKSGDAKGIAGAVNFVILARVQTDGAVAATGDGQFSITGAQSATILVSVATSYKSYQDVRGDAQGRAASFLDRASAKDYNDLLSTHLADFQRLFRRVSLDLGPQNMSLPTDQRVAAFDSGSDPALAALHFQFGRYLLISSSRPGGQPANLQGIWNDSLTPPWDSKYTVNINTEMNYWPAETTNLSECHEPLFDMVSQIAQTGVETAKSMYGAGGWMCHHNTDGWRGTAPVDGPFWGLWPTGGAWLSTHLWQHYLFTGDKKKLARHYPILKGAAQFFLDTLQVEPTHGWLVTCPSLSPENAHHPNVSLCAGPTMDMDILRDLFGACIEASQILDRDEEFRAKVTTAREKLAPMQIGHLGQLQEWLEDWDEEAPERTHRHVSHGYGLYPSNQITKRGTPDLFSAIQKTLAMRGDAGTGWSLAWKINFWARLEDGDRAYKLLTDLITPGHTAANLFDLHPPFQIDGNFGATSGIAEMLLQSHAGELHLLPALPSAWPNGKVTGLRARGGYTIDIAWSSGKLESAMLTPDHDGKAIVRYGEQRKDISTRAGKPVVLTFASFS
jgi:alpha-L-fucosidase 2